MATTNKRHIIVSSDYANGDKTGPYHPANKSDVLTDGNGYPIPTQKFVTNTTNYTILDTDKYIFMDCSSDNLIVTLPTAVGRENVVFVIKRLDEAAHTLTLKSNGGNIDGSASVGMIKYASVGVYSDGANWWIF